MAVTFTYPPFDLRVGQSKKNFRLTNSRPPVMVIPTSSDSHPLKPFDKNGMGGRKNTVKGKDRLAQHIGMSIMTANTVFYTVSLFNSRSDVIFKHVYYDDLCSACLYTHNKHTYRQ